MIIDPDFCDHWKTRMLVGLLDDEAAPVYVIRLWAHCQNRRQWIFEDLPVEAIKALCRFTGPASKLEASLVKSGFVIRDGGELTVLNWDEYNSALIASWKNGQRGGRPAGKKPVGNPTGLPGERKQETQQEPTGYPTGIPTGSREEKRREEENVIHTPLPPFETESEPIGDHDAGTPAAKPAEWTRWRDDTLSYEANLIRTWNSLSGVAPYGLAALQSIHQRTLSERLKDPGWNWQEAMKRFPLNWGTGISPPSLPWFLKESSVADILGGKYARGSPGGGKPGRYDGLKAFLARGDT